MNSSGGPGRETRDYNIIQESARRDIKAEGRPKNEHFSVPLNAACVQLEISFPMGAGFTLKL